MVGAFSLKCCLVISVCYYHKPYMMKLQLLMLLCFSAILYYPVSALTSDGVTLLSLLRHWTFVPPLVNSSWNASHSTPCSWVGVQCDDAFNVVSLNLTEYQIYGQLGPQIALLNHLKTIDLSYNNLSGIIPPELGNCSLLENLALSRNSFSGKIPYSLKNLQKLRFLDLRRNRLTGEIPESLFQIPHLEHVLLNRNSLTGSIPMNIGNGTNLLRLYFDTNQLTGIIPPSIGNCSKLMELFLDENQLHGNLPQTLNNLQNIVYLSFSNNSLGGTIPLGSGRCKSLYYLDMSLNMFSGGIPSSLGNCSGLTEFYAVNSNLQGSIPSSLGLLGQLFILRLPENRLSGQIPSEIGNCKILNELALDSNQLEGQIPSELGMLSELQYLQLSSNHFTGEIPVSIWKIPSLVNVSVYFNNLSGELPSELTQLKKLEYVYLFNNSFSGVIPQNFGTNSSLVILDVSYNYFNGNIPPNLCYGQQLERLAMIGNQLQGGIPRDIGRCTTLTRLRLDQNNLKGPLPEFTSNCSLIYMSISENNISLAVPSSLGDCKNLTDIDLSNNSFTGHIPKELGSLVNLQRLNLFHNKLEGPLPPELSNCNKMVQFDVGFNSLNGSLPSSLRSWTGLTTLVLRENHFTGGIPSFLSDFKRLSDLQLGGNMFGGQIPRSIGELQNLMYGLNVSANELTGGIPLEIGKLKSLQVLDLSVNNLTGNIEVLDELPSLTAVNISYNSFDGPLPERVVNLLSSSPSTFLGNPGLCVTCLSSNGLNCTKNSNLKPCDNKSTHGKGLSKFKVAMIALGSTLLVTFLLFVLVYKFYSKQDVNIFPKRQKSSFLKVVMKATENLNDRYIIGRGAHGVVYKVALSPDKVFAVKKIELPNKEGGQSTSMSREIETTGKIRHRNLVRIKNFWLMKDCGLMLYKYMENGSLHDVLHEKNPPPSLDWSVRYKIAVGIAHGLEYLHHDCNPVILHRDIKPKNILLDSDMEPHIADFGIAKLLDQSSTSVLSMSVPGTIGYIAPENAYSTVASVKSDVYSYGVVLLELITRKEVPDPSFMEETDIVGWVKGVWEETSDVDRIADFKLNEQFSDINVREQVQQVLSLALRCTEKDPGERPTMREVSKQLIIRYKAPGT